MKDEMYQEIFVRLKFPSEVKIDKRTFAWRKPNFDKFWMQGLKVDKDKCELSFTSEFNAVVATDVLKTLIKEKSVFTVGERISLQTIPMELLELKEEKEIYNLD